MINFAATAFGLVLVMGALCYICLPFSRIQHTVVATYVTLAVVAFGAVLESTGQPKPLELEYRDIANAEMVGFAWNEAQQKVWLWVMRDGVPISYVRGWPKDQKIMGMLQDKWRRRGASGDEFHATGDGEVAIVVPPQPSPEKLVQ